MLANKILLPDGGRFWDRSTLSPQRLVDYDYPENSKNLYQTGGFWVMRKRAYEMCKWDNTLPINAAEKKISKYNEDVDMSLRVMEKGMALSFDKENTVWHNDDSYTEVAGATLKKQVLLENQIDFETKVDSKFTEMLESISC